MNTRRAVPVLVLVSAVVLSGCYVRVPVENVVPIQLTAKSGRPDPGQLECQPAANGGEAAPADLAEARRLNGRALESARSGDVAQARTLWTRVAQLDPSNATVAYNLAQAHEELGDGAAAYDAYCRYLGLAPDAPDAATVRGRLAGLLDHPPDVPADAASLFRVGTGFAEQGEIDRAREAYDQAVEGAPDWADLRFNRALVFEALQENTNAVEEFNRYLEFAPNAPDRTRVVDKINALELQERGTRKLAWGRTLLFSGATFVGVYAAAFCFVIAPEECP